MPEPHSAARLVVSWLLPAQDQMTRSLTAMLVVAGVKTLPPLPTRTVASAAKQESGQTKHDKTAAAAAAPGKNLDKVFISLMQI